MIRWMHKYFSGIPPVVTDGFIIVMVQALTFLSVQFATDEAAKFISATTLFWTKVVVGELVSIFLAIKMYRSTAFAQHQDEKKEEKKREGETRFLKREEISNASKQGAAQ